MLLLNRKSLRLAELAPKEESWYTKEESRYTLRGIQITSKEIVVTDGNILVRVSHPKAKAANFPSTPGFDAGEEFEHVLLAVDSAKEIAKAVPNVKRLPALNYAAISVQQGEDGIKLQAAVNDLENPRVFQPRLMTGHFPAWDRVIPTKPARHSVTVDAELLGKLCKYAVEFTKDDSSHAMRLSFGENGTAIRLDMESADSDQGMTALLMPMRDGGKYERCLPTPVAEAIPDPFADVPEPRRAVVL